MTEACYTRAVTSRFVKAAAQKPAKGAAVRVAERIKQRLEDIEMTGRKLARALEHQDPWMSGLLGKRFALSLNELDEVAYHLKMQPGDLVRLSTEQVDLSPSELRIVRALRLLPPTVREHVITLAEYLTGVTIQEIDMLKKIRALEQDDLAKFDHYLDVTLLRPHQPPAPAATRDPVESSERPDGPTPRTGTRSKR